MSCVNWCNYGAPIPPKTDPDSLLGEWEIDLSTFSNWFRNEILGVFSNEAPTLPGDLYVACHSTICSAETPGTELSGDGYARTLITFERVSDIQRYNPTTVSTPAASSEWPTVAAYSLWDQSGIGQGNYYAFGNLATAISVEATKSIQWQATRVQIGMGSPIP